MDGPQASSSTPRPCHQGLPRPTAAGPPLDDHTTSTPGSVGPGRAEVNACPPADHMPPGSPDTQDCVRAAGQRGLGKHAAALAPLGEPWPWRGDLKPPASGGGGSAQRVLCPLGLPARHPRPAAMRAWPFGRPGAPAWPLPGRNPRAHAPRCLVVRWQSRLVGHWGGDPRALGEAGRVTL
jgi:hypothetical protein